MEIEVSIGGFNPPWERHEGATHARQLEFCLVFSLIVTQATLAENVWPPSSKSACSQVSAALFYVRTVTFVLAWSVWTTHRLLAGFSPASKRSAILSKSKHWSGGCRVCRTCSAVPASTVISLMASVWLPTHEYADCPSSCSVNIKFTTCSLLPILQKA